uniref:Transporter n=1 Tax=Rhizophora mucronata TaxID=61149 RepID=A0A2P2K941_RHIMU
MQPNTFFPHVMSSMVRFFLKLLAWIYLLLSRIGRTSTVQHPGRQLVRQSCPPLLDSSSQDQNTSHEIKEERLHPCWQRLQDVETMLNELANKPTNIPPEKEDMLLESLSRIKSIENDLQKTKKALLATASKQVELAETLENLKEDNLAGASSCWPRMRRTIPPER